MHREAEEIISVREIDTLVKISPFAENPVAKFEKNQV